MTVPAAWRSPVAFLNPVRGLGPSEEPASGLLIVMMVVVVVVRRRRMMGAVPAAMVVMMICRLIVRHKLHRGRANRLRLQQRQGIRDRLQKVGIASGLHRRLKCRWRGRRGLRLAQSQGGHSRQNAGDGLVHEIFSAWKPAGAAMAAPACRVPWLFNSTTGQVDP
jgi:hypothetical protein